MSKFISRLLGRDPNPSKKSPKKHRRPLWFETLEDRTVPTTTRVAAFGDFGVSSGTSGSAIDEKVVSDLIHSWDTDTHTGLSTGNKLDALVSVGDNTYPNASLVNLDRNIGQYYSDFMYPYVNPDYQDAYPSASLHNWTGDLSYYSATGSPTGTNRLFLAMGNHDWGSNPTMPQTILDYLNIPGENGGQQGNGRYFTVTQGPIQFFFLDDGLTTNAATNADGNSTGSYTGTAGGVDPDGFSSTSVQAQWLKSQLAASTASWKVILHHHPAFASTTEGEGQNTIMQWPFQAWGDPNLQPGQTPSTIVMEGHYHIYKKFYHADVQSAGSIPGETGQPIPYILEGDGGASLDTDQGDSSGTTQKFIDTAHWGASLITATDTTFTVDHYWIDPTTEAITQEDTSQGGHALNLVKGTALPVISLTASAPNAAEHNLVPGTFTLTRTGATTNALTVNVTITGTATNGTDYTAVPTSVTIPAGSASTTVTVTPLADTLVESPESVILTLAPLLVSGSPTYNGSGTNSATVTIADEDVPLISAGSSTNSVPWKYLDNGTNQGTAWTAPGFNDSAWSTGSSKLGYGNGDEQTTVSFGGNSNSKFITTYFRKSITVSNAAQVTGLRLRLERDDGAIVYINGVEAKDSSNVLLARGSGTITNMPAGAITSSTLASSNVLDGDETKFFEVALNPNQLVTGANLIAVEIHQFAATSNDIAFNLELLASVDTTAPAAPSIPNLDGSTDTFVDDDKVTGINTPLFTGTAEAGSTVKLYSDGGATPIGSGTATGAGAFSIVVSVPLTDGLHHITATATDASGNVSAASGAQDVTIDTVAPTVSITAVSPNPRASSVSQVAITFSESEAVGFDLADLKLTRDGGANLLTGTESLTTSDNTTHFTLAGLSGLTGQLGTYTLTLTAAGSGIIDFAGNPLVTGASMSFTVVANSSPQLDPINPVTFYEDGGLQTVNLTRIAAGPASDAGQPIVITATSSDTTLIPDPTVNYSNPNGSGTLTFTPVANANGTGSVTVIVNDGQASNNLLTRIFQVTVVPVNDPPTIAPINDVRVNEGTPYKNVQCDNITSGPINESNPLSVSVTSSQPSKVTPRISSFTPSTGEATLELAPAPHESGTVIITVTVNDGQAQNNITVRTFNVTIDPINDPPTLDPLNEITVNEDDPAQTVSLSGITAGPPDEAGQPLSVSASSSNTALILTPNVTYSNPNSTGTLALTLVANANGTATIDVVVNDGQSADNTVTRTFTVTVLPVNDAPSFDALNDMIMNEDALTQTVALTGISAGPANELSQPLTLAMFSSNPSLIPDTVPPPYTTPNSTGQLVFTAAPDSFGSATVTVVVNDGQGANNTVTHTFNVTVNPVNRPPTLNNINRVLVNEDPGQITVSLSGITAGPASELGQPLTVTASSSDTAIIPNPLVVYTSPDSTGTLKFTPATEANTAASGPVTITVMVNDGQSTSNTVTRTFEVTILPINDAPALGALNDMSINEDAILQAVALSGIASGPANELGQPLTVMATSSDTTIIPTPTVTYSSPNDAGTFSFAPAPDAFGTATISVIVNDGQGSHNTVTRSFVVTVNSINDPPTLDFLPDLSVPLSTALINLSGITAGPPNESQSLTVTAQSSNHTVLADPDVNYTSSNNTGSLTLSPLASGTSTITVTVNDGGSQDNTVVRTFVVTVL